MQRTRRRRFILAAAALSAAPLARAQQRRLPALGILTPHHRPTEDEKQRAPLLVRLRELGWVDGKTYRYVSGHAGGYEARLGEFAAKLIAEQVDVIFAGSPEAAVAAARATSTIPIVFWGVPDPVGQGLVDSLARPGRNATGLAWYAGPGVDAKRLQLIREVAPSARRLASMNVPTAAATVSGQPRPVSTAFREAADSLGFELREFPVATQSELDPAFESVLAWGAQAFTAVGTTLTYRERHRIVGFANRHRLPSCFTLSDFAESGGLLAYAIALAPSLWSAAEHIDRIFQGAKPADLPVIIPSKYDLTVNLKTARALGIAIPQSVVLRADRVIE